MMPIPFRRSIRSIEADSHRRQALGIGVAMLILGAWTLWMTLEKVSLYEVTDIARLEVDSAVHSIQSPVSGEVTLSRLSIGGEVLEGDLLVELDSEKERLQLAEEESRLAALMTRLAALRRRKVVEGQARTETGEASLVTLEEARAKHEEAWAIAQSAIDEAKRLEQLFAHGLVSEIELVRARALAQRHRSAAAARLLEVERLSKEQRVDQSDRQARLEEIQTEVAWLEGEIGTKRKSVERLRQQIEERRIRASVSGRLGEVANLHKGSVVQKGEKLGAIVPTGTLRVVADFKPSAAIGRVQPGQRARLRLDGFPSTEYGTVAATVGRVASEPRNGLVRVELSVHPNSTMPIPLQHGLPGVVEVEVQRVSPLALVLQIGGRLLFQPTTRTEEATNQ